MSEREHQSDEEKEKDFEKLLEESSLGSPIVKEIIKQGEALQNDMYKRTVERLIVDIFPPGKPPQTEKKSPKK